MVDTGLCLSSMKVHYTVSPRSVWATEETLHPHIIVENPNQCKYGQEVRLPRERKENNWANRNVLTS